MRWFRSLLDTLRPCHLDRDLDDEVQLHLEMRVEEYRAEGLSAEEARTRALRRFGSPLRAKERTRDTHVLSWLDGVRRDAVFGIRVIRRTPVLACAVVLSLALGIGATTGVFTVLDAVLLRDLPVRQPGDLSVLQWSAAEYPKGIRVRGYGLEGEAGAYQFGSFPFAFVEQAAARTSAVARVTAFQHLPRATTMARGVARVARGVVVTGGFFEVIGVQPALGRLLAKTDDSATAAPVVVLSYGFWQRAYGADPGAVGDVLAINGHPFAVVGVAPRGFFGVEPGSWQDFYTPVATGLAADSSMGRNKVSPLTDPTDWWLQVIARRNNGVDVESLRRSLETVHTQSLDPAMVADPSRRPRLLVTSGSRGYGFVNTDRAMPVAILMGLASLVLLIACVNVGNLLLARVAARRHEAAMRLALGASRWRLVRQQFTESLILAAAGGVAGLACARWFADGLLTLFQAGDPGVLLDVRIGWRLLAFNAAATVVAGLLFGLVPAISLSRASLQAAARSETRGPSRWRNRLGLARPLVAFQMAMSLLILVVAGLFVRSLTNLYNVPLGFNGDRLVLFEVDPVRSGYADDRRLELLANIRQTVARLPEVAGVAWSEFALVNGTMTADTLRVGGRPPLPNTPCWLLPVGPGFHETMQIPLLLGRTIGERDNRSAPKVAVVNETFVRTFLPDGAPLGQRFTLDESRDQQIQIVGVVRDAKYAGLRRARPMAVAYLADAQTPSSSESTFNVRASGSTVAAAGAIRRTWQTAYPGLPLIGLRDFDEQLRSHLASERMLSVIAIGFGLLALALAAVGLYGVVAFAVARRTAEIGVRIALGATQVGVMWLVLRDSAVVVLPGALLGLVATLAATKLLRAQLYGVNAADPASVAASVVVILLVSVAAAIVPARRAARVDPTEALRVE